MKTDVTEEQCEVYLISTTVRSSRNNHEVCHMPGKEVTEEYD